MKRKPYSGRMLYVTVKGTRTIIGVYGSALLAQAREYAAQRTTHNGQPFERMLWERTGRIQHVGQELKRGAKLLEHYRSIGVNEHA